MPAIHGVLDQVGMTIDDIGFTCSGSTDYLAGMAFSFVSTLDGVGPWPPIQESHVEMDGAWALYEAWVKLQLGEIDTALVYCYAKSSPGDLPMVLTRQLDPYTVAPLWADSVSLAALQAQALIGSGKATEADLAAVAARSRKSALDNPNAQLAWDRSADDLLAEPYHIAPLRKSDCPPITDGGVRFGNSVVPVQREALAYTTDQTVTVGVRPEHFDVAGADSDQGLAVTVNVVEELGSDAYVYGTAQVGGASKDLVVRVGGRNVPEKGSTLHVVPRPGETHVFSTSTGERLSA